MHTTFVSSLQPDDRIKCLERVCVCVCVCVCMYVCLCVLCVCVSAKCRYESHIKGDSILNMPGPKQLTVLNIEPLKNYSSGYHVVAQP